jgi:hypothetical protein
MTTPVTSASATPYAASATAATPATSATAVSPESTLAAIANSLMGLTTASMDKPATNPRLFARMERLVDSLARLIDAFANFKSASKSDTPAQLSDNTTVTPEPAPSVTTEPAPQVSAPEVITQPCPAPEAPAETPPQIEVAAETPVAEPPAPVPPPIELGQLLGKTGGFLWKPISDKNGDLAILIPKQLTGKVKEVRILNPDGTKSIAKGKYSGVGNGNREHYRFAKPGSGYPDRAIVLIKLEDGTARHLRISDTSRRIER